MERRFLPALADHGTSFGAFATKWEGWKNPLKRRFIDEHKDRINVCKPEDRYAIDDQMGIYVVLYEPSDGSRYVAYVGYSKALSTELEIRYGTWEKRGFFHKAMKSFPFACRYIPNQKEARSY
ncbi:MAG: hypothetical protein ACRELB_09040, partial [Polyangiaceae bacterium]